jgi:Ca-activated chloride channel homolog
VTRMEPRERHVWFTLLAVALLGIDALLAAAAQRRNAAPTRAPAPGTTGVATSRRRRVVAGRAAVLALAVWVGPGLGIGDLERGNRHYREGRYEEAVAAYERVLESGRATPQLHYNLGTALLALGRFTESEAHFQAALQGVDPDLRQRTFYNAGNRFLEDARGQEDVQRQGALLDAAIESYRRALRMAPDDVQAKWNLELALRDREQNEQQQQMPQRSDDERQDQDQQEQESQGGGAGESPQQPQDAGADPSTRTDQQPMSEEQADRILSAIEQDERELTREKLRRGQRSTPVLRDW